MQWSLSIKVASTFFSFIACFVLHLVVSIEWFTLIFVPEIILIKVFDIDKTRKLENKEYSGIHYKRMKSFFLFLRYSKFDIILSLNQLSSLFAYLIDYYCNCISCLETDNLFFFIWRRFLMTLLLFTLHYSISQIKYGLF